MDVIHINSYPQHFLPTFLLILPSNFSYKVGEEYYFNEWSNKDYLFTKYLVSKRTLPFSEITDEHTYLAKDCDAKLFFQIVRTQYKTRLTQYKLEMMPMDIRQNYDVGSLYSFIDKETLMDIMVFTDRSCVRPLMKREIKRTLSNFVDPKISLLSKKPIQLKNYCHESKFNKERERPYTDEELLALERDGLIEITDKCVVWLDKDEKE
ncbi:hypothetical protein [Flavivirga sp. 57AJ16]|uniref:hypothetical protein n=1 Tax=Flavivirga sp. 57AJ16 TaxID=3025307 RepID=UPI002366BA80|nr:hypothetical protein [Flavivirga sp. 57AJ16]MDD7885740.1 hypothetical protein [Flavivirga sp. 57AJ16]